MAAKGRMPGDPDPEEMKRRMIRVDHAGEYGALRIYQGQLAVLGGLCAVAFVINAGVATFHVGVEQQWWQGTEACGAAGTTARTIEELRAQIFAAPIVRCDVVPWSLFGISMAGYNVLASLGLAVASAIAARGMWRAGGDRADA